MKYFYAIFVLTLFQINSAKSIDKWDTTYTPFSSFSAKNMFFTDSTCGYIIDDLSNIIKTTNGGLSWERIYDKSLESIDDYIYFVNDDIIDAHFVNKNLGFCITEDDYIYKTTNGGQNWIIKKYGQYWKGDIFFINDNIGWYTGEYGEVNKTTDAGITWSVQRQFAMGDYYKIFFIDEQYGWAYGQSGGTANETGGMKTTNGGNTWTSIPELNGIDKDDKIQFINRQTGYAKVFTSLYKTTNGGDSWNYIAYNSYSFSDFYFINNNIGYAIIYRKDDSNNLIDNKIIKTTNGGNDWVTDYSSSVIEFQKLSVINDTCYVIFADSGSWNSKTNLLIKKNINYTTNAPLIKTNTLNDFKINITPNTDYPSQINIENIGEQDLIISNITFTGKNGTNFSLNDHITFPISLSSKQVQIIDFNFRSSIASEEHLADMIIYSNATDESGYAIKLDYWTNSISSVYDELASNNGKIKSYIDSKANKIIIESKELITDDEISLFSILGEEIKFNCYRTGNGYELRLLNDFKGIMILSIGSRQYSKKFNL